MKAVPRTVAEAEEGQAEVHTREEVHSQAEVHTRAEAHTRAEVHSQAEADTSAHPAGARSTAAGKVRSGSIVGPTAPLDAIPASKELAHNCSTSALRRAKR